MNKTNCVIQMMGRLKVAETEFSYLRGLVILSKGGPFVPGKGNKVIITSAYG